MVGPSTLQFQGMLGPGNCLCEHCIICVSYHLVSPSSLSLYQSANLWTRLGSASKTQEKVPDNKAGKLAAASPEEEDSELQRAWGALIKEKEQSRQKKSRLDHLPSLQIEISRESSSGSDTES